MSASDTFKQWLVTCEPCDKKFEIFGWASKLPIACPSCNEPTELYHEIKNQSSGIAVDSIPGGVEIRHLSTKPERFYSKTDIKRRCNEKGFVWDGDTPGKPYKVQWAGRSDAPAKS